MKKYQSILLGILLFSGCASSPDKLQKTYISPLQYSNYSCSQIKSEMARVSGHASQLQGQLQEKADRDTVQATVGAVLFWPTLFFLEGGDGADAQEYSRLKGEYDALEQAGIQKNCMIATTTNPEPVTLKSTNTAKSVSNSKSGKSNNKKQK